MKIAKFKKLTTNHYEDMKNWNSYTAVENIKWYGYLKNNSTVF